jgi:WD40 repeat protein
MTLRRILLLVLLVLAAAAAGVASRRAGLVGPGAGSPAQTASSAVDPRDGAATMPDPRGRTVFPDASCAPATPSGDAPAPRCVVTFEQVVTALGLARGGDLAITPLAHAATVGWTLPAVTATLLFEPLPADAEARAILVDEELDQALFAVGSQLWLYDIGSGRLRKQIEGPGGMIEDLASSKKGTIAVVAAGDGQAHLLEPDGAQRRPLPTKGTAVRVAVDPSGAVAAVATDTGEISLFDLESDSPVKTLTPSSQPVAALAFARNLLVVAGSDGVLRTIDTRSAREVAHAEVGSPLLQLAISADGRFAATAAGDRVIRLHGLRDAGVKSELAWHAARVSALAFGAGPTLLSADNDGKLAVWDLTPAGEPAGAKPAS